MSYRNNILAKTANTIKTMAAFAVILPLAIPMLVAGGVRGITRRWRL